MNTEQLIRQLAKEAKAEIKPALPAVLFVQWLVMAAGSVAAVLALLGVREDIGLRLHDNIFIAEAALLLALSAAAGVAAIWLSYPDIRQQHFVRYPPLVLLAGLVLFYACQLAVSPIDGISLGGIECTMCVIVFSAIPTGIALWLMRGNACTRPKEGGAMALLAGVSLGCLGLRFCEAQASITHLITWHYLPLALFTLLGTLVGKRFLRW